MHCCSCRYSPSSFSNVLTVGGTQRNDGLYNTFFFGTNFGSCVDIFAPAQRVRSAYYTGPDSYAVLDGTSQATPLVSGAAAVYWSMLTDNANASDVKNTLLNTCSRGKLNIAASVPSAFRQQTVNCLLHIKKIKLPKKTLLPPAQKVYHNVSSGKLETLIKEMEQGKYALSYLQNYHIPGNDIQYSCIFTNMKNKFKTFVFTTEQNLRETEDRLRPKGFRIVFIQDLPSKKFVAVLARNAKHKFTVDFRVTSESIQKIHRDRTATDDMTLFSTSVVLNTEQDDIL